MKIENEFIPYEQALVLKELGFDEPCFAYYLAGGIRLKEYKDSKNKNSAFYNNTVCSIPTFSQAFRWFREKYELFFNIYSSDPARNDVYWNILIFGKTKNRRDVKLEYVSMIYEEAELECLKKLTEIVKQIK